MKKITPIIIFSLLVSIVTPGYAQILLETPAPSRAPLLTPRQERVMTLQEKQRDFKERVLTIKDQRKQTVVTNIDTKIQTINERRTTQMEQALERLSDIIDRIASKAALAKDAGVDTQIADALIIQAKESLATAQTALNTQAAKTYVIVIEDETTLRATVGETISELTQDLRIVYQLVIDVRQKVVLAAREVAKINQVTPAASESAL